MGKDGNKINLMALLANTLLPDLYFSEDSLSLFLSPICKLELVHSSYIGVCEIFYA